MKRLAFILAVAGGPALLAAQQPSNGSTVDHSSMDHASMGVPTKSNVISDLPTMPGQDAYGAIGEIVRLLETDPQTDWSKVDFEKLRQHLIDMNVVTLQSRLVQRAVPGGIDMTITGDGRTEAAIRRMVTSHGQQLGAQGLTAKSEPVAGGAHFVVTAADPTDAQLVSKIRGLGFIGLMTLGAHHAAHHIAVARGAAMAGH